MVRKTRELALETRQRLLDAAEQLFDRQGVAATSLQQIATLAGATRGAVYWHFKDKADLFDMLVNDRVRQPLSELAESLMADAENSQAAPLDRVRHLMQGLAEGIAASERIRRALGIAIFKVERGVDGDLKRVMGQRRTQGIGEMHQVIQTALTQSCRNGGPPADPARAASGLVLIFDGLLTGWLMDINDAPDGTLPQPSLPERLNHIMEAYLRGLG